MSNGKTLLPLQQNKNFLVAQTFLTAEFQELIIGRVGVNSKNKLVNLEFKS